MSFWRGVTSGTIISIMLWVVIAFVFYQIMVN